MSYQIYESGIEVNGNTIYAIVDGMDSDKYLGIQILEEEGLGEVLTDPKENLWFSQKKWLRCFAKIAEVIGYEALFRIGTKIPFNAILPNPIFNLCTGLSTIDRAYHLNHRNASGKVLYVPEGDSGVTLEGIGHYELLWFNLDKKKASMKCENPYPCDFDMGLITSFCKLGGVDVLVSHKDPMICRKKNSSYCEYIVSWY